MKFKKILPILSTGIILSSNACAFANTTNNDDSQETSLVNTVKEDSNDSAEQNVQDNNDSVEQPIQDDNDSVEQPAQDDNDNDQTYDRDFYPADQETVNRQNNYTYIFKQLSDYSKYSVDYANNGECTAILKIKYPDGRYSPTYYIKPGEESDLPFHYAKAGYHEVRIDSQNPHVKLDGYLTIREYN